MSTPPRRLRAGPHPGGSGLHARGRFAVLLWWPLLRGPAARAGRFIPLAALGLVLLAPLAQADAFEPLFVRSCA